MTADFIIPIIIAIIAAGVPGVIALLAGRHKSEMDVASQAQQIARGYAAELIMVRSEIITVRAEHAAEVIAIRAELVAMQFERDRLEKRDAEWAEGIRRLIGQLVSKGERPVWTPEGVERRGSDG